MRLGLSDRFFDKPTSISRVTIHSFDGHGRSLRRSIGAKTEAFRGLDREGPAE